MVESYDEAEVYYRLVSGRKRHRAQRILRGRMGHQNCCHGARWRTSSPCAQLRRDCISTSRTFSVGLHCVFRGCFLRVSFHGCSVGQQNKSPVRCRRLSVYSTPCPVRTQRALVVVSGLEPPSSDLSCFCPRPHATAWVVVALILVSRFVRCCRPFTLELRLEQQESPADSLNIV